MLSPTRGAAARTGRISRPPRGRQSIEMGEPRERRSPVLPFDEGGCAARRSVSAEAALHGPDRRPTKRTRFVHRGGLALPAKTAPSRAQRQWHVGSVHCRLTRQRERRMPCQSPGRPKLYRPPPVGGRVGEGPLPTRSRAGRSAPYMRDPSGYGQIRLESTCPAGLPAAQGKEPTMAEITEREQRQIDQANSR